MSLPLNGEVIVTPCVSENEERELKRKGWSEGLFWEKRVPGVGRISVATSVDAAYLERTNFSMCRTAR